MKSKSQNQKQQQNDNKDIFTHIVIKTKTYLFHRNYLLTSKANITFVYVTILNSIFFIQNFLILSLPDYNIAVTPGSDMYFFVQQCSFLILKFDIPPSQDKSSLAQASQIQLKCLLNIILCILQVLLLCAFILPIQSKQLNLLLSKYIIHPFSTILTIPCLLISIQSILNFSTYQHNPFLSSTGQIYSSIVIYIALITIGLNLINRLIYAVMHFQFSIEAHKDNVFVRNTFKLTKELLDFAMLLLFFLSTYFLYPMSLLIYFAFNIFFSLMDVKEYCIGFNYHHQSITKIFGIYKIMNISISLCYFLAIAANVDMISQNMSILILTVFFFFSNFFLIFKKYQTKNIVIDSQQESETQKIIFIMWYFNCFRNRADKKCQLYLSSLLKNHSTKCQNIQCCCRMRQQIYDPSEGLFGSPTSQPHQDIVYIKHFFLKLLIQAKQKFPKCNEILFLLAFYYVEILNFIPQTIDLIQQLKKKSLKNNLTLSEDYVLYCLGETTFAKINEINHVKGNLDLEKARKFDLKILQLKDTIKYSVKIFSSLWQTICSEKYNQTNLVDICKVALQIMFKIEENYKQVRKINNVSSELIQLMLLYSKFVAHDIHLLSQQLKPNPQRLFISNSTQIKGINIFSPQTVCLISSQSSYIRWASKNCYQIFDYKNRQQFLKLRINDLMPKYFAENHDKYITKWLQTGFSSKLNKTVYLWGNTKDGFCFSLAIYIKIVPLVVQQDFAFFAAIQKFQGDNQIICGDSGEIYGTGRLFANAIKCSQKYIQDYRPNIQILIPSTFQLFLNRFFPKKKYIVNQKTLLIEVRRQGYFPKNLQTILKDIVKERQTFTNENNKKPNFDQLYCGFLKQKMQQITVYMQGQYISFTSIVHFLPVLQNHKKNIIVIKLTGFKKNSVQKYYNDLQKMISKIQSLKQQCKKITKHKSRVLQNKKSIKKDYFKILLNPKRVKKLLEQQYLQGQNIDYNLQVQPKTSNFQNRSGSVIVDQDKIIQHRKKLAINAQQQLKNERAKYNIFKMKKQLYEQGVFSRYTYNVLMNKSVDLQSLKNIQRSQKFIGNSEQLEQELSQQALSSDDMSFGQIEDPEKPQDNETFNSATSSAAFISMTNSIKMFKIKLRSLNTPKLLYWLNIAFVMVVMLMVSFQIWLSIEQKSGLQKGAIYFQKAVQSTWVIDSIMMTKISNLKKLHLHTYNITNMNSSYNNQTVNEFQEIKIVYQNLMHQILSIHIFQFSQYKKLDPRLLSYLFEVIPLNESKIHNQSKVLQFIQFFMRQLDYSKQNISLRNPFQIKTLLNIHQKIFKSNSFYEYIVSINITLFWSTIGILLVLMGITMPIIYRIESKVQEIMQLIAKISFNQRKKYYIQFTLLNQDLQNMNQTDSWEGLDQVHQSRSKTIALNIKFNNNNSILNNNKKNTTNTRQLLQGQDQGTNLLNAVNPSFTHQSQKMLANINQNSKSKKKQSLKEQQKIKNKIHQTIYFKILCIYIVLLSVLCIKYVKINFSTDLFLNQNYIFTQILIQKLRLTQDALIFNLQILQATPSGIRNGSQIDLTNCIYNSYHIASSSSGYRKFVAEITTNDNCLLINDNIGNVDIKTGYNTLAVDYLTSLRLSPSWLFQCSSLNNASLGSGFFTTVQYLQQKRHSILFNYNQTQKLQYLSSSLSIQLEKLQFYINTIMFIVQKYLEDEIIHETDQISLVMRVGIAVCGVFLAAFALTWAYIYLNIAERASYINAFLLLIPYDVLSQNPYIKLYIKNQFDYKSSVY